MANVNIAELPVMTESDFTANDRFLMSDDGSARLLPKTVFQSWLSKNVQGTQGVQGVAGKDGAKGLDGKNGINGANGLSAYQLAVSNGFVGTQDAWLLSLKGAKGLDGAKGTDGWTPLFRVVPRGSDSVLELYDWVGGTGTKPILVGYVSATGIVSDISSANNIRGQIGEKGVKGADGVVGQKGADGKSITSLSYNPDTSIKITYSDASIVTSNVAPKKQGWITYKDTLYTNTSPLIIPENTQQVLPNNAATSSGNPPDGIADFYDIVTQKYALKDPKAIYNIKVSFKVAAASTQSYINLNISKSTVDVPYSEDKALRGDNKIQDMSFSTTVYGDAALSSNGLTINLKTFDRAVSIYAIEVTISKLS